MFSVSDRVADQQRLLESEQDPTLFAYVKFDFEVNTRQGCPMQCVGECSCSPEPCSNQCFCVSFCRSYCPSHKK